MAVVIDISEPAQDLERTCGPTDLKKNKQTNKNKKTAQRMIHIKLKILM